jgi:hypothetical protein
MTKSLIRYTFKKQKQERAGTLFREVDCAEHCFIPEKRNDTEQSSNVTYMKPICTEHTGYLTFIPLRNISKLHYGTKLKVLSSEIDPAEIRLIR